MDNSLIQPIKRTSFRAEVYTRLREAIVSLALKPGSRLNDTALAAEFGVSRTPVREALKRLEDEGLVETVPGSITRVAPLRPEEARHAFVVAAALYALAARLAALSIDEAMLESMRASNARLRQAAAARDTLAAIEADDAFHSAAVEAAGNPEIAAALARLLPKLRRLEIARFAADRAADSADQHERIIEAFRKGDAVSAAELTETNWLKLGETLAETVEGAEVSEEDEEAKEGEEAKEAKEGGKTQGTQGAQAVKADKKAKNVKETEEAREIKDAKEVREGRGAEEAKEQKQAKEPKEPKGLKEFKGLKESKEPKKFTESKESKEVKEAKKEKKAKKGKEAKNVKEAKRAKGLN